MYLTRMSVIRAALFGTVGVAIFGGLGSSNQAFAQGAPAPWVVPKAQCGANDHPETGLQGQVAAPLRAAGFKGFSCNLELVSQAQIDGANWQSAEWRNSNSPDQANGGGGGGGGSPGGSGSSPGGPPGNRQTVC